MERSGSLSVAPDANLQAASIPGAACAEGKEYLVKDGDVLHFRFNV